ARNLELHVELAQREICTSYVGNQSCRDSAACFFGSKIFRPCGFAEPPQPPPYVELPTETKSKLRIADVIADARREKSIGTCERVSIRSEGAVDIKGGEQIRIRDAQLCARL